MGEEKVWVVEMLARRSMHGPDTWGPTVGVALTRADARGVLADWKRRNPSDRFRLRRYEASK